MEIKHLLNKKGTQHCVGDEGVTLYMCFSAQLIINIQNKGFEKSNIDTFHLQ